MPSFGMPSGFQNTGYGLNYMAPGLDQDGVRRTLIGEVVLTDCDPDAPLEPDLIKDVSARLNGGGTVLLAACLGDDEHAVTLRTQVSRDYFNRLGVELDS